MTCLDFIESVQNRTVHIRICECGYNKLLWLKDRFPFEVWLGVFDRLNVPAEDESVKAAREEVARHARGSGVIIHPGDAAHHPLMTLKGF